MIVTTSLQHVHIFGVHICIHNSWDCMLQIWEFIKPWDLRSPQNCLSIISSVTKKYDKIFFHHFCLNFASRIKIICKMFEQTFLGSHVRYSSGLFKPKLVRFHVCQKYNNLWSWCVLMRFFCNIRYYLRPKTSTTMRLNPNHHQNFVSGFPKN